MALCLVCDLSSIATEGVGKVFFKEKAMVQSFFLYVLRQQHRGALSFRIDWGQRINLEISCETCKEF